MLELIVELQERSECSEQYIHRPNTRPETKFVSSRLESLSESLAFALGRRQVDGGRGLP